MHDDRLREIMDRFSDLSILVVGDFFLDEYLITEEITGAKTRQPYLVTVLGGMHDRHLRVASPAAGSPGPWPRAPGAVPR